MSDERAAATVEWEVWRSHAKGGPDRLVQRGLSERTARALHITCMADPDLFGFCTFHLVKVTTTREEFPDMTKAPAQP